MYCISCAMYNIYNVLYIIYCIYYTVYNLYNVLYVIFNIIIVLCFLLRAKYHKLKYGTELNQGEVKMPSFEAGRPRPLNPPEGSRRFPTDPGPCSLRHQRLRGLCSRQQSADLETRETTPKTVRDQDLKPRPDQSPADPGSQLIDRPLVWFL